MTYAQLRSQHFASVPARHQPFLTRHSTPAQLVHAALLQEASERGASWIMQQRQQFAQAVRTRLGIAGLFAPLFQWVLVKLLELLLPALIEWLQSQLSLPQADPTTRTLDAQLHRFAQEAGR